jgi:hypothetical protein
MHDVRKWPKTPNGTMSECDGQPFLAQRLRRAVKPGWDAGIGSSVSRKEGGSKALDERATNMPALLLLSDVQYQYLLPAQDAFAFLPLDFLSSPVTPQAMKTVQWLLADRLHPHADFVCPRRTLAPTMPTLQSHAPALPLQSSNVADLSPRIENTTYMQHHA